MITRHDNDGNHDENHDENHDDNHDNDDVHDNGCICRLPSSFRWHSLVPTPSDTDGHRLQGLVKAFFIVAQVLVQGKDLQSPAEDDVSKPWI